MEPTKAGSLTYSFNLLSNRGISDQLAAQFSHLFVLGEHCGWSFKQISPFRFPRCQPSTPPRGKALRALSKIKRLALGTSPQPDVDDPVAVALGLNHDISEKSALTLELTIGKALASASSLDDFAGKVEAKISALTALQSPSELPHIIINVDYSYYTQLEKLYSFLDVSRKEIIDFAGEKYLRPNYQKSKMLRLAKGNTSIHSPPLVHIRIGDSLYLDTSEGPLVLHGSGVIYTSLLDFERSILSVELARSPWLDPDHLAAQILRELNHRGLDSSSLLLVSDGFSRSRSVLKNLIKSSKYAHARKALISGLRRIDDIERQFFRSFDWVPADNFCVGEATNQTIEAIDKIMNASLLFSSNGGFSTSIQNIYKKSSERAEIVLLRPLLMSNS